MKVLLLSCNTGQGHFAAAEALREEFAARGIPCEHDDVMRFADADDVPGFIRGYLVKDAYNTLVMTHPQIFRFAFQVGEHISSPRRRSPMFYVNASYAGHLRDFIESEGFDTVVCTHMFPAETLTWAQSKGLSVHSFAVATDYACLPFWEECTEERWVVPHADVIPLFVGRGMPEDRVLSLGLPIDRHFRKSEPRVKARELFELPSRDTVYLVATGSMGFGDVGELPARLLEMEPSAQVVVVCGTNDELRKGLEGRYAQDRRVHPLGYVKHMSTLLDACDVVLTKPGGLTSTEVAAKRIPLVHMPAIPGFESRNAVFFASHGMSIATDDYPGAADAAFKLVHNPDACEAMRAAQRDNVDAYAARRICDMIVERVGADR